MAKNNVTHNPVLPVKVRKDVKVVPLGYCHLVF